MANTKNTPKGETTGLKITKEIKAQANEIFKENPTLKTLYVNNIGEFFTSENLAFNSVKKPKEEVLEIPKSTVLTEDTETPE